MMIKCEVTKPYVERSQVDEFTWHVYSVNTGHIVASTYDDEMASAILLGIQHSECYNDEYAITKSWKPPEPLV
jgi:hypothetical protein